MQSHLTTWNQLASWKYLALGLMLVGFMSLGAQVTTQSLFTDDVALADNAFTSGSVDISSAPASAVVQFDNMAPGDELVAPLTVRNDGSLELRYALTSVTTEDTFASQLDMTVKRGVTDCSAGGFDADGTGLYGPDDLGSASGKNVLGDPATGQQAGDRTLGVGAGETLCFRVRLPLSTGNGYQGLSTTATLIFNAEQTANNA